MAFNIGMRAGCGELQKDHTRLRNLAVKWQMKFSIHKCELKGRAIEGKGDFCSIGIDDSIKMSAWCLMCKKQIKC